MKNAKGFLLRFLFHFVSRTSGNSGLNLSGIIIYLYFSPKTEEVVSILSRPPDLLEVLRQRGSAGKAVEVVVVVVVVQLLHAVAQILVLDPVLLLLLLAGRARFGLDPHDGLRLAAEAGAAWLSALLVLVEVEEAVRAEVEALMESWP